MYFRISVPYRGILFFNRSATDRRLGRPLPFPSPIGESYFSIGRLESRNTNVRFPSPIGESYFSIYTSSLIYLSLVSVPYRGILFFNTLSHTCLFLRAAKALCVGKRFFMEFLVFIRVQYPRKP